MYLPVVRGRGTLLPECVGSERVHGTTVRNWLEEIGRSRLRFLHAVTARMHRSLQPPGEVIGLVDGEEGAAPLPAGASGHEVMETPSLVAVGASTGVDRRAFPDDVGIDPVVRLHDIGAR